MAEKPQNDWVAGEKKARPELFSELDVLLRASEKFFIIEYLPISDTQYSTRNFYPELNAARNVVLRILEILDAVIPEQRKNAFRLKKFAESKFLGDRGRDIYRETLYKQDTQEQSLFLLYDSFSNLKSIVSDLLRNPNIQYTTFRNIGQLISKEIRENVFFNPFRKNIDQEFDNIRNKEISDVVKGLKNRELKKAISIFMLHLFRLLRYLGHIDRGTDQPVMGLHTSVAIMTLMRSELDFLRSYSEKNAEKVSDEDIAMLLRGTSYQFRMESRRIYQQELRDILEKKFPQQMHGRIENSHGILLNLIQQTIIQIAQHWRPDLKGEEVFEDFVNKAELSMKLREDVYVLHKLLSYALEKKGPSTEPRVYSLMGFMEYFESFTFKLLRYDDYEEFQTIFNDIKKAHNASDLEAFMEKCHQLSILSSTIIGHIEHRAELQGRPFDAEKAQNIVRQYVSAG